MEPGLKVCRKKSRSLCKDVARKDQRQCRMVLAASCADAFTRASEVVIGGQCEPLCQQACSKSFHSRGRPLCRLECSKACTENLNSRLSQLRELQLQRSNLYPRAKLAEED